MRRLPGRSATGLLGRFGLLCLFLVSRSPWAEAAPAGVLARHPDDRRVLVFRGKPTVLVGSGEHYGAVVNQDFDYRRYLDTLAADGLDLTRLFVGTYFEKPGAFGISANTLAPAPGRALVPWARSSVPGASDGGNKVDLTRWDEAYFARLRDFVTEAGKRGIVVEVVFFSSYYGDDGWTHSPQQARNNVNGVGDLPRERANTLDNGPLLAVQERTVRRIVRELQAADNVYYEIQNEPWADHPAPRGVVHFSVLPQDMASAGAFWKNRVDLAAEPSLRWQAKMAAVAADEERILGVRHLIAQNYANHRYPLREVGPEIDILNFHYAWPEAVELNAGHGRVIGFDETGFASPPDRVLAPETDAAYRKQAWEFLLAGGGVFSMLDYSFTVGHEDGTFANTAPGGGGPALRRQLRVLKDLLHRLDLSQARPRPEAVRAAPGAFTRALGADDATLFYLWGDGQTSLSLALGPGRYVGEWTDTKTGATTKAEAVPARDGTLKLESPRYESDIALVLRRER
jgi:hypothetical protein